MGFLKLTPKDGAPTNRATSPGEVTFATERTGGDGINYALSFPAGILPSGLASIKTGAPVISWDINLPPAQSFHYDNPYEDPVQWLGQSLTAFSKAADGTETQFLSYDFTRGSTATLTSLSSTTNLRTNLHYDIGYSYVAMGEWSWGVVDLQGNSAGDAGDLLFVNGNRTPSSGIPVSGTATYDARTFKLLASNLTPGIPFTLTADFGRRTIGALIEQDYHYQPNGDLLDEPAPGIHVSGNAPFSSDGLFGIPLAGTVNYSGAYPLNPPQAPPSQTVAGTMNGAFFGPHAEQVGGTFSLQNTAGTTLLQDAFVGKQH
jgi:hypothetical protein